MILVPPTPKRPKDAFAIARALVHSGVPVRTAKRALDELWDGKSVYIAAPAVHDFKALRRQLECESVAVRRLEPRVVDVRALRSRLGLTQEEFAGRYGLDVATVRNWEQGRTRPDGPAATLLQLIDRDPDAVVELLSVP